MTTDNTTTIDWRDIGEKLRAPFNPEDVDFRPQGNPNANGKAQAICYIDARTVADRLDEVVGPGAWSFTYQPIVIDKGEVQLAKGILTIHGVTKEDIGDASTYATSKGCVSDALKRAAVLWGIGRYLYGVGSEWVALDQHKRIPDETVARLRTKLPRPDGSVAHPQSTQSTWQKRPPVLAAPTPAAPATPKPEKANETLSLTNASALDQKRLFGQLAARRLESNGGFLKSVTGRDIDMVALRDGHSDLTLDELVRANERLTRMPAPAASANGKAGIAR